MVRMIRSTTAAAAPHNMASFCWRPCRERAASAITTALSPDRMMFTQMIVPSPSQKCDVSNCSIQRRPLFASAPSRAANRYGSEQPDHLSADHVDLDRRGHLGEPRHGQHVAPDHYDALGAGRQPHLAPVDHVVFGGAAQLRVGRKGVLRLGGAHRIVPVPPLLWLLELVFLF